MMMLLIMMRGWIVMSAAGRIIITQFVAKLISFSRVQHRTCGSKRPYCIGRRICVHNPLAIVAPMVAIARFWNERQEC